MKKYMIKFETMSKTTALRIGKLVINEIPAIRKFSVNEIDMSQEVSE